MKIQIIDKENDYVDDIYMTVKEFNQEIKHGSGQVLKINNIIYMTIDGKFWNNSLKSFINHSAPSKHERFLLTKLDISHNTDGLKTDYYDIFKDCTDVDSVMMKHELTGSEFTILKSLVGVIKARKTGEARHNGTSLKRDLNKIIHYTNLIKKNIKE